MSQETSSGEEEVEEEMGCGSMGCGTGSAEEIEEELGVSQDSLEVPQRRKTRTNLQADDVIVLEFARPQRKGTLLRRVLDRYCQIDSSQCLAQLTPARVGLARSAHVQLGAHPHVIR